MARVIYCWRCRADVPMLTEDEWATLSPLLDNAISQIKSYRERHGCSLIEARAKGFERALDWYRSATGHDEQNGEALFHHRRSMYGPPCHACGKPLRTPQARYCAACSAERRLDQGTDQ